MWKTGQSRVVPLEKKYTIPRLELLGNFILIKLMVNVLAALREELNVNTYFCWTDSMVSLAWIYAADKELKTFVQNKVLEIRKNVEITRWGYCKSVDNPADIITRLKDVDIVHNSLWWNGPQFLRNHCENREINVDAESELKKEFIEKDFNSEVVEKGFSLHIETGVLFTVGNIININDRVTTILGPPSGPPS